MYLQRAQILKIMNHSLNNLSKSQQKMIRNLKIKRLKQMLLIIKRGQIRLRKFNKCSLNVNKRWPNWNQRGKITR